MVILIKKETVLLLNPIIMLSTHRKHEHKQFPVWNTVIFGKNYLCSWKFANVLFLIYCPIIKFNLYWSTFSFYSSLFRDGWCYQKLAHAVMADEESLLTYSWELETQQAVVKQRMEVSFWWSKTDIPTHVDRPAPTIVPVCSLPLCDVNT